MKDCVINLKNVVFQYPKSNFRLEIDDVSFNKGEISVIVGGNGAGKTTLTKLMCGILKANEGEILLDGNDINKMSLGEIGQKVNYLFQEPRKQLFTTNVFSEMTFVGELLDKNMEEVEKKATMLLEKFNLSHCKTRSVYRLSRGETQRLALACLLMNDLEFLILDEPTTGLDKENREIFFETIVELKNNGIGVSIVTHDKEMIGKFDENIIELNGGKVCRLKISQQEINQEENLEENE